MVSARRTERYDSEHTTTQTYRTNLRRIREMLGLTRDEAIARIEPPKLTSAMLARVETGERGLSVEELVQLSVAYQVPPATILTPWSQQDLAKPPTLSGADYKTSLGDAQNWTLQYNYPPYPGAIARYGSAIQGALNARLYTSPQALAALASNPTPEKYDELILNELEKFLEPLSEAIETFYGEVTTLCGFDPRPHFKDFEESEENGYWPDSIDSLLLKTITTDPAEALTTFREKKTAVDELKGVYLIGYGANAMYSTAELLRGYPETVEALCSDLDLYHKIETAINYAYKQQSSFP